MSERAGGSFKTPDRERRHSAGGSLRAFAEQHLVSDHDEMAMAMAAAEADGSAAAVATLHLGNLARTKSNKDYKRKGSRVQSSDDLGASLDALTGVSGCVGDGGDS